MPKSKLPCSIDDCNRPAYGRGLCNMHYLRWRKHGDPLVKAKHWGECQRYYEEIVLPFDDPAPCLTWPFGVHKGYAVLRLPGKKGMYVSRHICLDRHGPPPTQHHQAAHLCGKGHLGCVNPFHLAWKTRIQNEADKLIHGTRLRGSQLGRSSLTETDIRIIRYFKGKVSLSLVAELYNVSVPTISEIQNKRTWTWVGGDAEIAL